MENRDTLYKLFQETITFLKSEKMLFLMAGGINTLIGIVSYAACIIYLHLDYRLASLISLLLAICAGFLQSRHGIFRSGDHHSLKRYLVLWTGLYFFSIGILGLFIGSGFSEIEAYFMAIPLSVPLSFWGQKYWVFKERSG